MVLTHMSLIMVVDRHDHPKKILVQNKTKLLPFLLSSVLNIVTKSSYKKVYQCCIRTEVKNSITVTDAKIIFASQVQ